VAQLIALAKRLDPGLSDRDFADAGRQLDRMPAGVFARYGLDAATVATLRERFAAWPRACVPGQSQCDSYDEAHWLGFTPLRITSVTFAGGAHAKKWAVVSDYGGTAEVNDPPSRSAPRTAARSASTRGTRSTGRLMPSPTARTTRAPGSTTARPVRDHATMRRPVRARLHLLRHDHQTSTTGELALAAGPDTDGPPGRVMASAGHRYLLAKGRNRPVPSWWRSPTRRC